MHQNPPTYRCKPLRDQLFSLHAHERIPHDKMEAHRKEAWHLWRGSQKKLSLRGPSIFAFCRTTLTPGFHLRGMMVTTLSLAFRDVLTNGGLTMVSRALKLLLKVEDLTVTGLPDLEEDGWILRGCKFALRRFATDLLLYSVEVLDFLEGQGGIMELKIMNRETIPGFILPREILPGLQVLECPERLMACFARKGGRLRPLKDIRLKLDGDCTRERGVALLAVSRFGPTLGSFSLDFETEDGEEDADYLDIPEVIDQLGTLGTWPVLKYLEFCGGDFDDASVIAFMQSIVNNFATVESLLWAPASVEKTAPEWVARTLYKGSPSLRYFSYIDPASWNVKGAQRCTEYAKWDEDNISRGERWLIKDGGDG